MKKILSFVVLAAIMLVPSLASAAVVRVDKELGWGTYVNGQPITVRFGTQPVSLNNDTTGVFSLQDAAVFGGGFPVNGGTAVNGGFSGNDSLIVAYVVLYRDSTAAGTTDLTAITATIQATYDAVTWTNAGTSAQAPVSGSSIITIPLYMVPNSGPTLNLLAPRLRIAFGSMTGALPAARVKIIYAAEGDRR